MNKFDNLDLLRALFITNLYSSCKNNEKCNKEINTSFKNEPLSKKSKKELYAQDSRCLSILDQRFLRGVAYQIGDSIVSKYRVLKNMSNYIGNGDRLIESLRYNAECNNIDEVISIVKELVTLEKGVNDVKLSKGV